MSYRSFRVRLSVMRVIRVSISVSLVIRNINLSSSRQYSCRSFETVFDLSLFLYVTLSILTHHRHLHLIYTDLLKKPGAMYLKHLVSVVIHWSNTCVAQNTTNTIENKKHI